MSMLGRFSQPENVPSIFVTLEVFHPLRSSEVIPLQSQNISCIFSRLWVFHRLTFNTGTFLQPRNIYIMFVTLDVSKSAMFREVRLLQ